MAYVLGLRQPCNSYKLTPQEVATGGRKEEQMDDYPYDPQREEMEYHFGPRLWDATPGVCCAAYQLGACEHTEAFAEDYDLEPEDLEYVAPPAPPVQDTGPEPF